MNAAAARTPLVVHRSEFQRVIVTDSLTDDSSITDATERRAFQRGQFSFVGVRARITLKLPHGPEGHAILHEVESPGLWGVQTDSGEEYFAEVFAEESDTLADMLSLLGVDVQP
jgi:hypothetical protein